VDWCLECEARIIAPDVFYGMIRDQVSGVRSRHPGLPLTLRTHYLITCRKMTAPDVTDAFDMLSAFLSEDEHYLASSKAYGDRGIQGLNDALYLFLEHPDLGFVWMAYDEQGVAGICVICYAVSTSMGSLVAKLDDVSVKKDRRGKGIGTALLDQLKKQLKKEAVSRIDVAVHVDNPQAREFYERIGFVPLNEERLACVI
jgi:ribosomal protein S18 acetylase RimI-like enzyme